MKQTCNKGVTLYSFESPAFESVTTFVTTRHNPNGAAHAQGNFNLGLYCGDNTALVENNLQQLCDALDISRSQLYYPRQVHDHEVLVIDEGFMEQPRDKQLVALDGVDAIITHLTDIAIAVTTADCVPIILFDTTHRVVAAVHAGWRGTAQEIIRHTVERMKSLYGTNPAQLQVAIAPCIGVEAYEVGFEVIDVLRSVVYNFDAVSIRNKTTGKIHVDLAAVNVDQLLQCGVDLMNIEVCGICTYHNSQDFYSVRALGNKTGRFLTGVMMR